MVSLIDGLMVKLEKIRAVENELADTLSADMTDKEARKTADNILAQYCTELTTFGEDVLLAAILDLNHEQSVSLLAAVMMNVTEKASIVRSAIDAKTAIDTAKSAARAY